MTTGTLKKSVFVQAALVLIVACHLIRNQVVAQESLDQPEPPAILEEKKDDGDIQDDPQELTLPDSAYILQRRRLAEEIQDQHAQLLSQLSVYQEDERKFKIAHDQYTRLQTLNSIEGVVAAAKKLTASRNSSLNSYLNLLRLKLIESEGVELSHKNKAIGQLENLQLELSNHSAMIDQVADREGVNELNSSFGQISERFLDTSYYTLSILTIGRLQAVYDQAYVINQRIKENISPDQLQLSDTRSRNLVEIEKLLDNLPPLFQNVWAEVVRAEERHNGYDILYRGLNQQLNTVYVRLSRLIAYYEEVEGVR